MNHKVVLYIALDGKALDTFYLCRCETATISQHSMERNLYHEETYFYCVGYLYRRLCGLNGAIFLASASPSKLSLPLGITMRFM